jgi:Protein kinase domain
MRLYAVCASTLLLLTLPLALSHLGTTRIAPLVIPFMPSADGTLHVRIGSRLLFLEKVSLDGAPPIAAAGAEFLRQSQALPPGSQLTFFGREQSGERVRPGGVVRHVKATSADSLRQIVAMLVASVFAIFGLGVAIAAAEERAALAGAAMSGVALLFGPLFVGSTIASISLPAARSTLLVIWQCFPRALGLYWLPAFAAAFPRPLPRLGRLLQFLLRATLGCAIAATVFNALLQLPDVAERLPLLQQRRLIVTAIVVQDAGYALFLVATLTAIAAQLKARRVFLRGEQRRGAIVIDALAAGVALPMLLGVFQIASLVIVARPVVPSPVMLASFMTLLVIPPAVAYATRARRVDSVRLIVRRAVLFAFARRTIQALSLVPILVLVVLLYRHRAQPLIRILDLHPFAIGTTILAAALSLRFAAVLENLLDTLFFRERADERRILRRLAETAPRIDRLDDLSQLLEVELDRALHLESVSLFVREPAGERFRGRGVPWFLEPTSHVVDELARTEDFYDIDDASQFKDADEIERLWLTEARVRMLVPLRGGTGVLIGFLALGEKRSDLPFDREDRMLLGNIAVAAALAVDNHILRSSPPVHQRSSDTTPDDESPAARYCPSCRAIFECGESGCPADGTNLVDAAVPLVIAGKYRLDSYLGAGGMGVVFRARDLALGRPVAIKTLPRLSTASAVRFRREARFGAALMHPALAAVYAAETWHGRPLLVLEYLPHGTLASRIASGPLPLRTVVECAIRISEALAALHEMGVLHRDVKPSNIGFAANDDAKLLDFGLARLLTDSTLVGDHTTLESPSAQATESSGIAGTPAYLPPEVIVGRRYDPAVDLWGLSMSMYEGITGRHPFHDGSALRMMNRIVSENAPDPRTFRAECTAPITAVLLSSLARDAARRPRDGRALARAWREAAVDVTS